MFVLLIDESKAFDKVIYCILFTDLLKRDVSSLVLRLVLHMYMNETLSNLFSVKIVSNKVVCYLRYSLLKRLQYTGVGCHMGHHFSGALAYANDITLLSPSRSGYFSKRI